MLSKLHQTFLTIFNARTILTYTFDKSYPSKTYGLTKIIDKLRLKKKLPRIYKSLGPPVWGRPGAIQNPEIINKGFKF